MHYPCHHVYQTLHGIDQYEVDSYTKLTLTVKNR